MRIYNYRTPNINCDRPWKDCIFNDKSQLTSFKAKPLVAFNNQHVIQQHDITYITGKDACHAHHFAKMLATAVLYGEYQHAPSISVSTTDEPASILWIDTVRGPHACAAFFQEMTANLDNDDKRFHLLCLDMLGSIRENFWELTREVENYINVLKPSLVVVDDIDHLMPHSGINVAAEFNKIVRDTINHTDTPSSSSDTTTSANKQPQQERSENSFSTVPIASSLSPHAMQFPRSGSSVATRSCIICFKIMAMSSASQLPMTIRLMRS